MSFFAFIFIGGLTLKGLIIHIELSIDRLSVKYDTKIISLPVNEDQVYFNPEKNVEVAIEADSNSLKPVGKQIYMRAAS